MLHVTSTKMQCSIQTQLYASRTVGVKNLFTCVWKEMHILTPTQTKKYGHKNKTYLCANTHTHAHTFSCCLCVFLHMLTQWNTRASKYNEIHFQPENADLGQKRRRKAELSLLTESWYLSHHVSAWREQTLQLPSQCCTRPSTLSGSQYGAHGHLKRTFSSFFTHDAFMWIRLLQNNKVYQKKTVSESVWGSSCLSRVALFLFSSAESFILQHF